VAETVESAALALESVDHIKGGDSLATSVFSVSDGVLDNLLKENLQNASGLLIDEAGDALHTATTRQTADGGLCDALDVVT
jgi:hypothetical protein